MDVKVFTKTRAGPSHAVLSTTLPRSSHVPQPAEVVREALRPPGQPLDASTRSFMEPRFGHDFSQVRVHTESRASESARAMDALAYTVGNAIVFDSGRYAPKTPQGDRLIAHELAHVVQQGGAPARLEAKLEVSSPGDRSEQEAEQMAARVVASGDHPLGRGYPVSGISQSVRSAAILPQRIMRQTRPHSACTRRTAGVPNPEVVLERVRTDAEAGVAAALRELAAPTSQTHLAVARYFHCPESGAYSQIRRTFQQIQSILPQLAFGCMPEHAPFCTNGVCQVPNGEVMWCPWIFTVSEPGRQSLYAIAAAALAVGRLREDLTQTITNDFSIPPQEMLDYALAYGLFAMEGQGYFMGGLPDTIPCRPTLTTENVVVPTGAENDPRLIYRLGGTVQPNAAAAIGRGGTTYQVYRDRSGNEFIFIRNLPGARIYIAGEQPRYYFPGGRAP